MDLGAAVDQPVFVQFIQLAEVFQLHANFFAARARLHAPLACPWISLQVHKSIRRQVRVLLHDGVVPGVVDIELDLLQLADSVHGFDENHAVAEDGALDEAKRARKFTRLSLLHMAALLPQDTASHLVISLLSMSMCGHRLAWTDLGQSKKCEADAPC